MTMGIRLSLLLASVYAASSSYYIADVVSARDYYKDRNWQPALQKAKNGIQLNPEGWEAYLYAAKVSYELKQYDEAIRFANQGIEHAPEDRKQEFRELAAKADTDKPRKPVDLRGSGFHDPWEVFAIDGDRDSLYVKNPTVSTRGIPTLLVSGRFSLLRSFMQFPSDSMYSPLGRQTEFENVADRACSYARLSSTSITPISMAELEKEFQLPPQTDMGWLPRLSARYSMIRISDEERIEIVAAAFSCKDPVRRRFRIAQQRAGHLHLRQWSNSLNQKLADNKERARRTSSGADSMRVTDSRTRQVLSKAIHAQLAQLRSLDSWLDSNEPRIVMSKEDAVRMKTEGLELKEKLRFQLERLDRHPTSTQYFRQDILFIQYLFNAQR